jgi:hypothetical protein
MKFKKFYSDYDKLPKTSPLVKTEEDLFEEVTGVEIPSMKSFVAWLILHEHIPPFIKVKNGKPIPITNMSESNKILFLTKNLPNLKELACKFSGKFEKKEYLHE